MTKSFHQYSPRAQVLTCAMVSALGMAAAWQALLVPDRDALAARRARLAAATVAVERVTQTGQDLPDVQRRVLALEAELHRTAATLPDEQDTQAVLRRLHALAGDANLSIRSFTPQPAIDRGAYSEWPMEVDLEGGFHDLSRFFGRLAEDAHLISVSNLHLKTNAGATATGRGLVLASCTASTVVFHPSGAERRP